MRRNLAWIALATAIVLQIGLISYVLVKSSPPRTTPTSSERKTTTAPAARALETDRLNRTYRTELLNNSEIDATDWEVPCEFFACLKDRQNKTLTEFRANRLADDRLFDYLQDMPLKHLDVTKMALTGRSIGKIARIKTIHFLEIARVDLAHGALSLLLTMPKLTWLRAIDCKLNDDELKLLSSHQFEFLVLTNNSAATDRGIASLSKENLRVAGFNGCAVTDRTALLLSHMATLTTVELYRTKISDRAFTYLSHLHRLQTLNLSGTGITDRGLATFKPPTSLKELIATDCPALTEEGVKRFRDANAQCTIDARRHK